MWFGKYPSKEIPSVAKGLLPAENGVKSASAPPPLLERSQNSELCGVVLQFLQRDSMEGRAPLVTSLSGPGLAS
jgi:hypothetical protein